MPPPRTVLIADDRELLRELLSTFLDGEADLQVVAAVSSGEAALETVCRDAPDAILLDHEMADRTGLEVLPELRARCPRARIVMFSSAADVHRQALSRGADEFVAKDRPFSDVADALRVVRC